MNGQLILEFLIDLKFNNNKLWFGDNKERYQEAKGEFEQLIGSILTELKHMDSRIAVTSSKDCIFRIFRDVRFSKNKEPYKTNFGALIAPGGRKKSYAGYYIHIEPDESFVGGGSYMPEPDVLRAVRKEIYENVNEFKQIINEENFRKYFPDIYGEKLTLAPKGFPKDFKDIDLLKYKHYAVAFPVSNSFWTAENIIEEIMEIYRALYPFNNFLNRVIKQ